MAAMPMVLAGVALAAWLWRCGNGFGSNGGLGGSTSPPATVGTVTSSPGIR